MSPSKNRVLKVVINVGFWFWIWIVSFIIAFGIEGISMKKPWSQVIALIQLVSFFITPLGYFLTHITGIYGLFKPERRIKSIVYIIATLAITFYIYNSFVAFIAEPPLI